MHSKVKKKSSFMQAPEILQNMLEKLVSIMLDQSNLFNYF